MNFKNFKPFERMPRDVQLMIAKQVHAFANEEVNQELKDRYQLKIDTALSRLEDHHSKLMKHIYEVEIPELFSSIIENDDVFTEDMIEYEKDALLAIDYKDNTFIVNYFQCCIDCNCCEHHNTHKPHSLKNSPMERPDFYSRHIKDMMTDTCKCSCQFFAELFLDANVILERRIKGRRYKRTKRT